MTTIEKYALYGFYPVMFFIYFLLMFGININSFIGLPVIFILFLFSFKYLFLKKDCFSILISIWLLYNLLSIVQYSVNGRPLDCYSTYIKQFVFPIVFYYYGKAIDDDYNIIYRIFGYSCIFCLGLGLILYITTPDFYVTYLNEARHGTWFDDSIHVNESNLMAYTRFSSFWATSYAVSYLGIPALCFSFLLLDRDRRFSIWLLLLLISTISLVMCMQRIAIAFVILYLFYIPLSGKIGSIKNFAIFISIFSLCALILPFLLESFDNRFLIIEEQLLGRIDAFSFTQAMSEGRASQYDVVFSNWERPIFGLGLGAASSVALSHGFPGVTDGEYIRILAESGIIGFGLFLCIVISTVIRGISLSKFLWAELLIVIYFLAACIGSNALSIMHLFTPMFWFSMGRIWNFHYCKYSIELKKNKDYE